MWVCTAPENAMIILVEDGPNTCAPWLDAAAAKPKHDTSRPARLRRTQWCESSRHVPLARKGARHACAPNRAFFFFFSQECTLTSWAFFNFLCHVRADYEICQPPLAHTGMCNRGQLSTTLRARRYAHTHTHTSAAESRGSQRRTRLRHTVPHAAMLFLSHDARQQMAVRREGENNCGHARRPPTHLSTSEPRRDTTRDCARALELNR